MAKQRKRPGPRPKKSNGGRPRKTGERYPGGKLKPDNPRRQGLWRRIQDHGAALAVDPRLGSELARLTWFGHLAPSEFDAGDKLARTIGRWERANRMPRRSARSPSYDIGYGRGADVEHEDIDRINEEYRKMRALIPSYPSMAWNILETVCVENQVCPILYRNDLKVLLARLADHWGLAGRLTDKRKRK